MNTYDHSQDHTRDHHPHPVATDVALDPQDKRTTRPVSIPHLVFGIVFSGLAAIWFLSESTGADLPRTAIGFPLVLIGAGVIGLTASFVNARRRSRAAYAANLAAYQAQERAQEQAQEQAHRTTTDETTPIETEDPR